VGQLTATLDALAKNKKANVVSNPNITTVTTARQDPRRRQDPADRRRPGGQRHHQLTKIGIQMAATPHVNSDKTITMDLHTEVSELSSQATVQGGVINPDERGRHASWSRTATTAIIGGLVRNIHSSTKTGIRCCRACAHRLVSSATPAPRTTSAS
jgi:type II secretory pathway component GspD/PulD (secretin)